MDTNTYRNYQDALGRILLTSNMWSDPNQQSFMAVTAHWMANGSPDQLVLCSALIAFREVDGCHTGDNLGQILFDIIQDVGIVHKVCVHHALTPEKQV